MSPSNNRKRLIQYLPTTSTEIDDLRRHTPKQRNDTETENDETDHCTIYRLLYCVVRVQRLY